MLILESGQTFQNIPFSVLTATMTFPVLDLLCVLSALTATGHALSCKVCMASFSLYCDGPSVDCPDGHACISSYTLTTLEGSVLSKEFARSCSPRNMCNSPGSVSIPRDGKIKRSTSCCYTDDCLPPTPTLPEDNFKPNGLICSTCVSPDTVYCYTSDTMRCTGDENMCILESTRQYAPIETQTAIRGCATQSICNIGRQELSFGLTNMTIDMRCTSASSPLHSRLVLPFTVAVATVLTLVLSC